MSILSFYDFSSFNLLFVRSNDFIFCFFIYLFIEFNISDFNEPGKAFGDTELQEAIKRGAIKILDEATIADMKAKRARDKARDEVEKQEEAIRNGATDWQAAMKEWEEWEAKEK